MWFKAPQVGHMLGCPRTPLAYARVPCNWPFLASHCRISDTMSCDNCLFVWGKMFVTRFQTNAYTYRLEIDTVARPRSHLDVYTFSWSLITPWYDMKFITCQFFRIVKFGDWFDKMFVTRYRSHCCTYRPQICTVAVHREWPGQVRWTKTSVKKHGHSGQNTVKT